ncbi:MAG TPA: hypothetical protein PKC36_10120, partial [Dietzia sp.]|nr:hypothetical protein [Dietzia sp.]
PPVGLLAGAAGAVGLGAVAGILSPVLPLVVAVAGLPALTALATTPRWSTSRSVRRSPGRVVLALGLTVLVFVVDWVLALVLGFFVGGPVSAALTWVVFGVTAAFLATHWAVLHRRAAG